MFAWWQTADAPAPIPLAALSLLALIGSASLTLWIRFAARTWEGRPPLAYEPRRPVPWTVWDLLWVLLTLFGAMGLFVSIYDDALQRNASNQSPETSLLLMIAEIAAKLTALCAALTGFRILRGATPNDWGLVSARPSDFFIALVAAIAVLPPVYALNFALSQIEPTQHPMIRLLQESNSAPLRLFVIFSAGLFAPVWEELFFRSILQGWLERVLIHRDESSVVTAELVEIAPDESGNGEYAFAAPAPAAWWMPIVISSIVFSAVHIDFAKPRLDFIPIFFFALALGYLYQRTHRILPSILLHMALNVTTLAMLFSVNVPPLVRH